jgi:hypothetical protein
MRSNLVSRFVNSANELWLGNSDLPDNEEGASRVVVRQQVEQAPRRYFHPRGIVVAQGGGAIVTGCGFDAVVLLDIEAQNDRSLIH